jgi:hypothetical protein
MTLFMGTEIGMQIYMRIKWIVAYTISIGTGITNNYKLKCYHICTNKV